MRKVLECMYGNMDNFLLADSDVAFVTLNHALFHCKEDGCSVETDRVDESLASCDRFYSILCGSD